jgi:hypothetical protein
MAIAGAARQAPQDGRGEGLTEVPRGIGTGNFGRLRVTGIALDRDRRRIYTCGGIVQARFDATRWEG